MMKKTNNPPASPSAVKRYFVDEAGDSVLFNRKGQIIIGQPGCSRYFMMGFIDTPESEMISTKLDALRKELITDPYFAKIPSMQATAKKTALAFHAKDDIPEIRWRVFNLLLNLDFGFQVAIKSKQAILEYVKNRNQVDSTYRYSENEPYDYLVRRLFANSLHSAQSYEICFAKRGKSDRTYALKTNLEAARFRFTFKHGIRSSPPLRVVPSDYASQPCLQVTDYCLWAVQRFYECGQDRFLSYIWPKVKLIQDIDDLRNRTYGEYYDQKNPISETAIKNRGI